MRALGLMSGTSLDGVDAAVVDTDGIAVTGFGPACTVAYPDALRAQLRDVLGQEMSPQVRAVEEAMTRFHAEVVRDLAADGVEVIGFHGQTLWHRPQQRQTLQIGDGALLARLTGIPVVNDFRTADVAAGGQGAPLVPVFHQALAHNLPKPLAVLNLGGVGNVTWLGTDGDLLAFDTGPGNALLDDWMLRHSGQPCDRDGATARQGRVNDAVVTAFSRHPYFQIAPPKSLDRDDFAAWAVHLTAALTVADGAATLVALTVQAVVLAQPFFPQPVRQWLVCGGGRLNPAIMAGLAAALAAPVAAVETVGWDGDALEAQAFALLAVRSLHGLPLTFPRTTGGPQPLRGGRLHSVGGA